MSSAGDPPDRKPKDIVLCFDDMARQFAGDDSDSNVMKIHPGTGTYMQVDSPNSSWHEFSSGQALGSSLSGHVMDAYKSLISQYSKGDYIHLLGFARGGYTAGCLAEMVARIGLLSRGNEHSVLFAWNTFLAGKSDKDGIARRKMENFKHTFCQEGLGNVYFLGLFDCVKPAGQPDLPFCSLVDTANGFGPAEHIRHAVAFNERHQKYDSVLFYQEDQVLDEDLDVQEVWFAGNHYEVGGSWPAQDKGDRQWGDIALTWMFEEIENLANGSADLPASDGILGTAREWSRLMKERADAGHSETDDSFHTAEPEGIVEPEAPAGYSAKLSEGLGSAMVGSGTVEPGWRSWVATFLWSLIGVYPTALRDTLSDQANADP
ncbi:MAG: hypothetical protein Q9223_007616 [Gallowayella weberi]